MIPGARPRRTRRSPPAAAPGPAPAALQSVESTLLLRLSPLSDAEIPLVAQWLSCDENNKWLDFGLGRQLVTPPALKVMTQREIHHLTVFGDPARDHPIGVIGLSDINRVFCTAALWYVLGEKDYADRGYTTRAVSQVLAMGFGELNLHTIYAWTVETNRSSIRVLEKNGFAPNGRIRKCHLVDGCLQDRLLFDLIAEEFRGPL